MHGDTHDDLHFNLYPGPAFHQLGAIPSGKDSLVKVYSATDAVYRSVNDREDMKRDHCPDVERD